MTDTKQPKETFFDASEYFNRIHGHRDKENPKESRPITVFKEPMYQKLADQKIERSEEKERAIWDDKIYPIIKEHHLFWKGKLIEYQFFPNPETIDGEGLYLMQRKTMVLCMEIGFPEKGIRKKKNEKEPNDTFEGPDDFIKLVIDDLKRKNYGKTEFENIEGIKQDLGDIFRLFLIDVLEDETLPYFLEFIRQETEGVKSTKQKKPRPSTEDKVKCQEIAIGVWKEYFLDIKYMKMHPDIKKIVGRQYKDKTVHEWLSEEAPDEVSRKARRSKDYVKEQLAICKKLKIEVPKK